MTPYFMVYCHLYRVMTVILFFEAVIFGMFVTFVGAGQVSVINDDVMMM